MATNESYFIQIDEWDENYCTRCFGWIVENGRVLDKLCLTKQTNNDDKLAPFPWYYYVEFIREDHNKQLECLYYKGLKATDVRRYSRYVPIMDLTKEHIDYIETCQDLKACQIELKGYEWPIMTK